MDMCSWGMKMYQLKNDNVKIGNLENKNFEDEMPPGHNVNYIIDHTEHDNAHEPYISL